MRTFSVFDVPLSGFRLVEAGAGTGKTYNITGLYIRAILEKDLKPDSILVLTYTNAATAELRSRIRNRIFECITAYETNNTRGDGFLEGLLPRMDEQAYQKLKDALYAFDDAVISTIHGFCSSLLRDDYMNYEVHPDFELIGDDAVVLKDCVDAYWHQIVAEYSEDPLKRDALQYLLLNGLHPDYLLKFVKAALDRPYALIAPETKSLEEGFGLVEEFMILYRKACRQYKSDGAELIEIVVNESGKLNGQSYKSGNTLNEDFENWLLQNELPFMTFPKLHYFGGSMITSKVKKGHEVNPPAISQTIDEINFVLEELYDFKYAFIKQAIQTILTDYNIKKKELNLLMYSDLIQTVSEKINSTNGESIAAAIATRFPMALVDEFQDTDPLQYGIFRKIYQSNGGTLFMIGDPKQAIYNFRGADLHTYLKAKADTPVDHHYSLDHNYRSAKGVLDSVNTLFTAHPNPFLLENVEYRPALYPERVSDKAPPVLKYRGKEAPALQFVEIVAETNSKSDKTEWAAEVTAGEIARLLGKDYTLGEAAIEHKDIAVLVYKHDQAETVKQKLAGYGLKSVIRQSKSVFHTAEAEELRILLSAVVEAGVEGLIKSAFLTSFFGFNARDIQEISTDDTQWQPVLQRFSMCLKAWRDGGISSCLNCIDNEFRITENLAALQNGERRITNYLHLADLLSAFEAETHAGPSALLRHLGDKINDKEQKQDEELLRLESDENLIQISTIHSSKGLEYPIVFLPFLWAGKDRKKPSDGKYVHYHEGDEMYLDISGNRIDTSDYYRSLEEGFGEEIRLVYVALTRAVSLNVIPYFSQNDKSLSMMETLAHGSENILSILLKKKEHALPPLTETLKEFEQNPNIVVRGPQMDAADFIGILENEHFHPQALEFHRTDLHEFPVLTSYSSITESFETAGVSVGTIDASGKDYDEAPVMELQPEESAEIERNVFSFPRGVEAGTFLHTIIEQGDFKHPDTVSEITTKELEKAGIGNEWKPVAERWFKTIVEHPILPSGMRLTDLSIQDLVKEMEFHFPIKNLKSADIYKIIRPGSGILEAGGTPIFGFMKGFIDLTFVHDGKYYILDYKSNHLGNNYENYSRQAMENEMTAAGYDVQYHIYTVALHRFLQNRLPGYDYERDFGGAVYLFIRGLNKITPELGVYFNRPEARAIEKLDQLFQGGNGK